MTTIDPAPMNAPPSWRCQTGAGNLARSTSLPLIACCRKAASLTTTGARGCNVLRFSIHALSASSGRNFGSMPSASAARCGLVVALVKMRKPRGKPLMASNKSAGPSDRPPPVDGPDPEAGTRALDAPPRPKLVDKLDEFAQILVHSNPPAVFGLPR